MPSTVTNSPPKVPDGGVGTTPDTGDGVLAEGEVILEEISNIIVTFNEAMDNTTTGDEVSNPLNYLLLSEGNTAGFQTTSCQVAKSTGVDMGDIQVPISTVSYTGTAPYQATLNLAAPIENGNYRLYACGTATLRDLAGNALLGGADYLLNFSVQMATTPSNLPSTGFRHGQMGR
ncbi:MAG: hypothetical protein HN855_03850 [Anaerolineae bacterium]|nr:hypothetical protein [Anaerolineae bacterium]MBT7324267.1 hypothetical protein [Anaerolineae bacterium]